MLKVCGEGKTNLMELLVYTTQEHTSHLTRKFVNAVDSIEYVKLDCTVTIIHDDFRTQGWMAPVVVSFSNSIGGGLLISSHRSHMLGSRHNGKTLFSDLLRSNKPAIIAFENTNFMMVEQMTERLLDESKEPLVSSLLKLLRSQLDTAFQFHPVEYSKSSGQRKTEVLGC